MPHIYKITNPKGRIYIGSSVNVKKRIQRYIRLSCTDQTRLFASLDKYGWDNHKFEIIAECSIDDMLKMEAFYGHTYDVLGKNGLNCNLPKNGDNYQSAGAETKKKMSEARIGRAPWNKGKKGEYKLNADAWKGIDRGKRKGTFHSVETRKKLSISNTGKKQSPEQIEKRVSKLRGHKFNVGKKNKAKIILNTETGIFYIGTKEAADTANLNNRSLMNMLNPNHHHKNKTAFIYA